jgi:hypothetical protein
VDDPASSSKLVGKERFMGHDESLAGLIQEVEVAVAEWRIVFRWCIACIACIDSRSNQRSRAESFQNENKKTNHPTVDSNKKRKRSRHHVPRHTSSINQGARGQKVKRGRESLLVATNQLLTP